MQLLFLLVAWFVPSPADLPALGPRPEGEYVYVVADGFGPSEKEARTEALAVVRSKALSYRQVEVRETVNVKAEEWRKGGHEGGSQSAWQEILTRAKGNLQGEVREQEWPLKPERGFGFRLQVRYPRERLRPGWKVRRILDEAGENAGQAWKGLRRFIEESRILGDMEACELALRMGLAEHFDPQGLLELAQHLDRTGRRRRALDLLARYRPDGGYELERLQALEDRLRGIAVDGDLLRVRLDRLLASADRELMSLRTSSKVLGPGQSLAIYGTLPKGRPLWVLAIDEEEIVMPWRWSPEEIPGDPISRDSSRINVAIDFEHSQESSVPGKATLIFLCPGAEQTAPPVLAQKVLWARCRGEHPDPGDLGRLGQFVDALADWLAQPGNQAQAVSWQQTK